MCSAHSRHARGRYAHGRHGEADIWWWCAAPAERHLQQGWVPWQTAASLNRSVIRAIKQTAKRRAQCFFKGSTSQETEAGKSSAADHRPAPPHPTANPPTPNPPTHSSTQNGRGGRGGERGVEIWLSSERTGSGENKSASVHGEFSQAAARRFLNPAASERRAGRAAIRVSPTHTPPAVLMGAAMPKTRPPGGVL